MEEQGASMQLRGRRVTEPDEHFRSRVSWGTSEPKDGGRLKKYDAGAPYRSMSSKQFRRFFLNAHRAIRTPLANDVQSMFQMIGNVSRVPTPTRGLKFATPGVSAEFVRELETGKALRYH